MTTTKKTTIRERLALRLITLAAQVLPNGHRSIVAIDLAGKTILCGTLLVVDAEGAKKLRRAAKTTWPDDLDGFIDGAPLSEFYRDTKGDEAQLTHKQQRDQRSIGNAIKRLEKRFQLRVLSDGRHLQFQHERLGEVNYWPTTGRWWVPKTEKRGMGLDMLAGVLGVKL
jgi:hypothetical protein